MEKCEKKFQSFFWLSFSPPILFSFFYCYYYYYYCRFSCVACSHLFASLSSLTKSQGGETVCDFHYRLFFFFPFFSSNLFLFDREEEEKNRCKKEQGCDNTYSISIWKRQQVDGISSQNTTVEPTKQKLYYPIERTRA
jgi:hypothetical protein